MLAKQNGSDRRPIWNSCSVYTKSMASEWWHTWGTAKHWRLWWWRIDVNEFGFPLGTDKGNRNGVIGNPYNIGQGNAGCIAVWQALIGNEYSLSNNRNANDQFDFITRRVQDKDSHQSVCYYTYTKKGYERDPERSTFVIWYDSKLVVSLHPNRLD